MNIRELTNKALEICGKYDDLNKVKICRTWSNAEYAQGFVVDVGALMKLIIAKEGIR